MEINTLMDLLQTLRERLKPAKDTTLFDDALEAQSSDVRKAAVLLALFEQDGELFLAFIRRASSLRSHAGEIAFPGGRIDPTDSSPVMAALREAQEEIGLDPVRVEVFGLLPPVFTVVSNYLILPVVAFLPQGLGEIQLQTSEVTELILAPLRSLADPTILHTETRIREQTTRIVYFYSYGPHLIWGATGRILYLLLKALDLGILGHDSFTH